MPPDNTALRGRSFERIRVYVINSAVLVSGMLRGGQGGEGNGERSEYEVERVVMAEGEEY